MFSLPKFKNSSKENFRKKTIPSPKLNIAPENLLSQKGHFISQAPFFRGYVKLPGCW